VFVVYSNEGGWDSGIVEKQKFGRKPEGRDNLEDIDVGGKVILKCIIKK
jgi:hypothetical protein